MATKKTSFSASANSLAELDNIFDYEPERKKANVTSFEEIAVSEIKLDPKNEFTNLYPLDQENINKIAESIKKRGFRKSQALTLIFIENENDEFLGDGHNRLAASKIAELEKVPVYRETYATRKEAKIAMLELQLHRRNLSDALKFKSLQMYMELKGEGKAENGAGKKSEAIAEIMGISARQVDKMNAIRKSGDKKLIDAVLQNKKTISKAYNEVPKKKEKKFTNDNSSHLDSYTGPLEEHSNEPKALSVSHIEHRSEARDYTVHPEDETDRWLKEKNIQVESAKKEGYAAGLKKGSDLAYEIYEYILSEIESGKSAKEIRNDIHFDDFSVARIYRAFNLDDGQKQETSK